MCICESVFVHYCVRLTKQVVRTTVCGSVSVIIVIPVRPLRPPIPGEGGGGGGSGGDLDGLRVLEKQSKGKEKGR